VVVIETSRGCRDTVAAIRNNRNDRSIRNAQVGLGGAATPPDGSSVDPRVELRSPTSDRRTAGEPRRVKPSRPGTHVSQARVDQLLVRHGERLYEIEGDHVKSERLYFDQVELLTQLGLMPAPAATMKRPPESPSPSTDRQA
jgi:hypothetical protein